MPDDEPGTGDVAAGSPGRVPPGGRPPRRRGQPIDLLELAAQVALVGEATLVRHRRY